MNAPITITLGAPVEYPDSDGQPMSDNTLQWECMVTIKSGLEAQFIDDDNVFISGDLLWYPEEGHPKIRTAADIQVAFGRPKGYRGSYKQWEEGGVAPQVVFEVLSPGNRFAEMLRKFHFYERYGVEEYYLYDPYENEWSGWQRGADGRLHEIPSVAGWVSPRLKIRFETTAGDLELYHPDGRRFLSYVELMKQWEKEHKEREEAQQRADQEKQRADQEKQRADRLIAQLRALGVNPEG